MNKFNFKAVAPHTWVSVAMVGLLIVNHALIAMGKPVIDMGEEQVTLIVNTILDLVVIGYGLWKNNSFTERAQAADEVLYALRDGIITRDELNDFIEKRK